MQPDVGRWHSVLYPAVSLAKARKRRDAAREQLADGVDPNAARRQEKLEQADAASNTFEIVARDWLAKTAAKRAEGTQARVLTLLEHDVFPFIGIRPISKIGPRDVLEQVVRKIEARGSIDPAHRAKQVCGQIFRYGVAVGLAERDVTSDLRGAIASIPESHFAAITEPKQAGQLMRAIFEYAGHATTVAALMLSPLVFVRPGELRTAEWAEIGLDEAEWRIPGSKMKMKNDHVVPWAESDARPPVVGLIVDTSIERDHQRFCGFLKISLEEVLMALRDDRHLLNDPANILGGSYDSALEVSVGCDITHSSLYQDGFDFGRFVEVIESESVWE